MGGAPAQWAGQVVEDLSEKKTAYRIWRGKLTIAVCLAGFLPVGALDFMFGKMSGLGLWRRVMKKRMSLCK